MTIYVRRGAGGGWRYALITMGLLIAGIRGLPTPLDTAVIRVFAAASLLLYLAAAGNRLAVLPALLRMGRRGQPRSSGQA